MKLTDYAKAVGVHWRTANRWFHDGQIPGAYQMPSGAIIVPDSALTPPERIKEQNPGETIIYARVSSNEQRKTNLETQAERLTNYAIANGWKVDKVIKEVGSGLNEKRPKLTNLLKTIKPNSRIIIEHKDRLTRAGFEYINLFLANQGTEIIVVNPTQDDKEDLIQDFISIITSYCARIYGQRRGKRKTEIITEELEKCNS